MTTFEVHHPLIGAEVPTFESLRERADADAVELLDIAARLCRHRVAEQRQLRQRAEKLDAPPWACSTTRLRTHPETLVPGDLLRAFLVCDPDRISATLGEDLRTGPYAAVAAALGSWSGPARRAPPRLDAFELRLHPGWARRFALADVCHGRPQVTATGLLAALGLAGLEGLAPFSQRFDEGAATRREVALGFVQRSPRELVERLHEAVPPAYVDRHGGLAALDAALADGPGALVVGAPRTGRSELVRAWMRRGGQGSAVVLDPHRDGAPGKPLPVGALAGLTVLRDGAAGAGRGDDARLSWLAAHAGELGPSGSLRVVVTVEPGALGAWIDRVPALGSLPRVEVPALDPPSLAAIWLAHTLARPGLGLDDVLVALEAVGLPAAAGIDPWALDQLVRPPGLLVGYDEDEACRELLAAARGGQERDPALLRALGGAAGIEALRALEARLRLD